MSAAAPVYPAAPAALPLDRAAYRYWMIRHLLREHAMDLGAADTALAPLRGHPHPRVARLADDATREVAAALHLRRGCA